MTISHDWTHKLYNFNELYQFAKVTKSTDVIGWLKGFQIIPAHIERIPTPDYIITNLDPDKIPAGYLAALAYEWVKDGPSTPLEFVESLRPEMRGTPEREAVRQQLDMAEKDIA